MLFEYNVGTSISSAFILVGLHFNAPANMQFSCTNITFQHMQGAGLRLMYVQAGMAPNVVEHVTFRNLTLATVTGQLAVVTPPAIDITAVYGGAIRAVLMDSVRAFGTRKCSLNATGALEGVVFTNGELSAPAFGGGPTVVIDGGGAAVLANSTIGSNSGDNVDIGAGELAQGTLVANCTLAGVSTGHAGIALGRANGSVILGNRFSPAAGAVNTTGIVMDFNYEAGTTNASIHQNDVRAMAVGVVCGQGAGNNCSNNPGAKDCS